MSAYYDLTLNRNESFSLYLDYLDVNDAPVDLTSYYARMMIKQYRQDPDWTVSLKSNPYGISCGSTGTAFDGPSGGIKLNRNSGDTGGYTGGILVKINPYVSMEIPVGKSFYDIFIVTDGKSTKVLEGAIEIVQEVTKGDNGALY